MATTTSGSGATGSGRAALSIGACLALAAGVMYFIQREGQDPEAPAVVETRPPSTAEATGTADQAHPSEQAAPETAVPGLAPDGAGELAVAGAAAGVPPGSQGTAPSVDVMRVEASGSTVIAGRARPGANVAVLSGNRPLAEVRADEAGRFVAMFDAGASEQPRALTVESTDADGARQRADQVLVMVPTAPVTLPAPGTTEPAATEPRVAAAAVLSPEAAVVTPLARPEGADEGQVAFSSISYGDTGSVALAGFGAPGAAIRVYVDEALTEEGRVGSDGRWQIMVPEGRPGTYRIRVDQIDEAGKVVSRTETPFRRDTGGGPAQPGEVAVVVQPGNNLWTLARIYYGSGVRYTQIFDANANTISNPDLIYPGQVFRVPDSTQ